MNNTVKIVLFLLIATVSGCKVANVTVLESRGNFKLSSFRSFSIDTPTAEGDLSSNYPEHISFLVEELAKQMVYRGLIREEESPDIYISLGVVVEEHTQTRETSLVTDPGTFTYIGQRRYTWKSETVPVGTYRKGTVRVDLVDVRSNEALWIGVVEEILDQKPEKLRETIVEGVEKLVNSIP